MTKWMVLACGYSSAKWKATWANSNADRSGVGGEVASRFRLYCAENIGRAAALVLVVSPHLASPAPPEWQHGCRPLGAGT
jgi:hypothetical protein